MLAEIKKNSRWAIALRDHDVNDWSLLPFKRGDIVVVMEKEGDSGWYRGEIAERAGWFPKEAVEFLFGKPTPRQIEEAKLRLNTPFITPDFFAPGSTAVMPVTGHGRSYSTPVAGDTRPPLTLSNSNSSFDLQGMETSGLFTIFEYAKQHFRVEKKAEDDSDLGTVKGTMKGTLRRLAKISMDTVTSGSGSVRKKPDDDWKETFKVLKYSKDPIKNALHKTIEGELNKGAVEIFMMMMSYMGDYPGRATPAQLVGHIVSNVLRKEPLRDEVYCQLLKQLTGNKSSKKDGAKRGWDLMAIFSCSFPPSDTLQPYLLNALQQVTDLKTHEFSSNASECIRHIYKVTRQGARKMIPPPAEIASIETNTPMSMRVHFPGDVSRMVMIEPGTTAEEVMQKASAKIHMKNPERFGLYVSSSVAGSTVGGALPVVGSDYIVDVLTLAERMASAQGLPAGPMTMKKNPKQKAQASGGDDGTIPTFHIICKKKIWVDAKRDLESDVLVGMMYHQLRVTYVSGHTLSAQELQPDFLGTIIELAAIQMKAEGGVDKSLQNNSDFYRTVIPTPLYPTKDAGFWKKEVLLAFQRLKGDTDLPFKKRFVETLMPLPLFGHGVFEITATSDPRMFMGCLLAVGPGGLIMMDRNSRAVILTSSYDTVVNFRFDESELVMKLGDLMTKSMLQLQTKEGFEIADLIQSHTEDLNRLQMGGGQSKKYAAY